MGFARNDILFFCLNVNARDTCINVALTVLYRHLWKRTMNLSLVYGNESQRSHFMISTVSTRQLIQRLIQIKLVSK